jgi:hypothetical protein
MEQKKLNRQQTVDFCKIYVNEFEFIFTSNISKYETAIELGLVKDIPLPDGYGDFKKDHQIICDYKFGNGVKLNYWCKKVIARIIEIHAGIKWHSYLYECLDMTKIEIDNILDYLVKTDVMKDLFLVMGEKIAIDYDKWANHEFGVRAGDNYDDWKEEMLNFSKYGKYFAQLDNCFAEVEMIDNLSSENEAQQTKDKLLALSRIALEFASEIDNGRTKL